MEFGLCSKGFSILWESSLSFCPWILLKDMSHFGSIAIQLQFVVASLELLQLGLMWVPLKSIWWLARSTFLFFD